MSIIKTISNQADAVLVQEEGDVLLAYRCPAGVWTIGTGLTAASGVIKPQKGMRITREESRTLRRQALARNYEPRVLKALPTEKQHVFDGAVLFDFNTGAINRASWVEKFRKGALAQARLSFLSWNKAAGKVLAGLTKRRQREWSIIEYGNYGAVQTLQPASLSAFADHVHQFRALGYDPAKGETTTIIAFQRDHGLNQDGLIGPATRATLERVLAAKAATKAARNGGLAGATAGGGADIATNPTGELVSPDTLLWVLGGSLLLAAIVFGAAFAWRYRGPLFTWLPEPVKDWFEGHGIVLGRRVRT